MIKCDGFFQDLRTTGCSLASQELCTEILLFSGNVIFFFSDLD